MAPGGTITGSNLPYLPGQPAPTFTPARSDSPEPDVIREWRERRDLQIQHRDEVSAEHARLVRAHPLTYARFRLEYFACAMGMFRDAPYEAYKTSTGARTRNQWDCVTANVRPVGGKTLSTAPSSV